MQKIEGLARDENKVDEGCAKRVAHVARRLSIMKACSPVLATPLSSELMVQNFNEVKRLDRFARGFSLRDALYFYVAAIGNKCIVSCSINSTPTVVDQCLPLALVAQQMARLMG